VFTEPGKPKENETKKVTNSILVITVKAVSDRYNAHKCYRETRNIQVTRIPLPRHCYIEKYASAGVSCTKSSAKFRS
jgi:hypothetical protein